jgi:hypothetical protein
MVQLWFDGIQLSINPQKKAIRPFTRKENVKGQKTPTVPRQTLRLTPCQTPWAYIGQWIYMEATAEKCGKNAYRAYWTSKDTFGKTWGLTSKVE